MDRDKIELAARLGVIEYMIAHLHKIVYQLARTDDEIIRAVHAKVRAEAATRTIPGVDPAQSDLLAAEIEAATDRLLTLIEELAGVARK